VNDAPPAPKSILRRPLFWAGVAVLFLAALVSRYREPLFQALRQAKPDMSTPFPPAEDRPTLPPRGERTEALVLETLGPALNPSWEHLCTRAGVPYPPGEVGIVALKDRAVAQIYARAGAGRPWAFLREYPVLAASGSKGPKLREGDRQVPEGIYGVEYLNPNSSFHLSFKVNYPNATDLRRAEAEGRSSPGSDIMLHGNAVSVGCLAMGDPAIEEIYVLAATAGRDKVKIVIAPRDFREEPPQPSDLKRPTNEFVPPMPAWTGELYEEIARELEAFPKP
jgi:hypothetical protein